MFKTIVELNVDSRVPQTQSRWVLILQEITNDFAYIGRSVFV